MQSIYSIENINLVYLVDTYLNFDLIDIVYIVFKITPLHVLLVLSALCKTERQHMY